MTGSEVLADWRGRSIRAWVPDRLSDRDTELTEARYVRSAERAKQAVIAADLQTPSAWEPLARLLLRAEGVASSYIEGVRAPAQAVAIAVADPDSGGPAAAWVAANLAVIDAAISHAHGSHPLTVELLNDWHRLLMAGHSRLGQEHIGALRREQGWIGGSSPLDAALVTPPPGYLADLVADLLVYLNAIDLDAVTQAAIGHAQFEIIHPYADGNGRLGRIITLWVLARRIGVRILPPVSTRIAAEPGAYLAELTNFRLAGCQSWVGWFADTLAVSAATVTSTMAKLDRLTSGWSRYLDEAGVRSDAAARRLLVELVRTPVLTSEMASVQLGISTRAARSALSTLAERKIVEPFSSADSLAIGDRRVRWWYAPEVSNLLAR